MNEFQIDGIVGTTKDPEQWLIEFVGWLESRGEWFSGGVKPVWQDTSSARSASRKRRSV